VGLGASERLPILMGEPNRVGSFLPQPLYMRSAPSISVVVNIKGGGCSMKIEVMVDKDNTHFSYMFECDKIIDGSRSRVSGGGIDPDARLVIMKKTGKKEDLVNGFDKKVGSQDEMDTIAVFNCWTFWRKLPDGAKKCTRCSRYAKLVKRGLCQDCLDRLPEGAQ